MERFELPKTNPEGERVARLAEAAEKLAPSLDLKLDPDLHIHQALNEAGITDIGERKRLIGKIKKALHRRKPVSPKPVPFSERENIIEQARIQELGHPKENEDEA